VDHTRGPSRDECLGELTASTRTQRRSNAAGAAVISYAPPAAEALTPCIPTTQLGVRHKSHRLTSAVQSITEHCVVVSNLRHTSHVSAACVAKAALQLPPRYSSSSSSCLAITVLLASTVRSRPNITTEQGRPHDFG